MSKVYLFYDKITEQLYAYTENKKYSDEFMKQRGKHFYLKKVTYDSEEELDKILGYFDGPNMSLQEICLNTSLSSKDDVKVIGTMNEEDQLFTTADILDNEIKVAHDNLSKLGLKKKYMEAIEYLSSISYLTKNDDGTKDNHSRMNLLSVFMNYFSI